MRLTQIRARWGSLRPATRVLATLGALMLLTLFGAAVFADVIAAFPPDRASGPPFARPSKTHWLGTDDLGRDLWAQLVHGARVTLAIGMIAAIMATAIGTTVALVAGWHGGWLDTLLMRIVDLTLAVPFLVLILVLATYFGRGALVTTVLLTGVLWARPARLLRSQVLKLRQFGHVVAADAMGAPNRRILVRHILHRLVPLLLSQFVRAAAVAVIVQSGVAFLGLGDPDRVSWGSTLFFANNGAAVLTDAWLWWIVPPGMALTLLIVGLAFVGLAFEEIADPGVTSFGWHPGVRRVLPQVSEPSDPAGTALEIRDFTVKYGEQVAVDSVDLSVANGRVFGLVGESGSGKSSLVLGILGLLPPSGRVSEGEAFLEDIDLRRLGRSGLAKLRGRKVSVIPQAAMSLLDPTMTVLNQVVESTELTSDSTAAKDRAVAMLQRVGIPAVRHTAFPHELSGGQRQRVVIAMAVANQPRLLVADEPTTGLDVITQHEILDLIDDLRADLDLQVLIISHDLQLIATRADDLAIMYAGKIVEVGQTHDLLHDPEHPYTRLLISAFPTLDGPCRVAAPVPGDTPEPNPTPNTSPALELAGVDVHFKGRRGEPVTALTDVTLTVNRGERVAMVGRSGAGKSTAARLALGLLSPTAGNVSALGTPLEDVSKRELRPVRRRMHMVFQDPYQSLHPGQRVRDIVAEPLAISAPRQTVDEREAAVNAALTNVGLTPVSNFVDRRPGSLSGGQRQRVALARALVAKPELILADEPTSMLDASLRATIVNLLLDLQQANDAAMMFITHDLALARQVADRIVVLESGAIVEDRPTEELLNDPEHPETKRLLAAAKHQSTANA